MKVQGVNNNQNYISHKAYFKQNKHFMDLYKNAEKPGKLAQFANDLKTRTPNHELEILNINKLVKKAGLDLCEIKNNTTKKIDRLLISNNKDTLLYILSYLCLYRDSDFFKFEEEKTNIDCLDILTKND